MKGTSIGFRIATIVLSLFMFIFLAGLVPLAIVAYKKGTKFNTATVEVKTSADEIYSAALGIIYDDPDIELRKKNDRELKLEARRVNQEAKIEVKQISDGKAELIVKANAGKKADDIALALHIVERICGVLDVEYQVVEQ
jgi:hypothetical protein